MTIALRFLRDRRRSFIFWVLGIGAFVLVTIGTYPLIKNLEEIDRFAGDGAGAQIAGAAISVRTPEGFLHSQFFAFMLPILMLVFGIAVGARAIAGAEDEGVLELMLSNPVSRRRVALERYLSAVGQTVLLGLITTIFIVGSSAPFGLLDGVSIANLTGACLGVILLAVLYASLAFAWGASRGARGASLAIAASFAVGGFVIYGLAVAGVLTFLRFITPWWWYLSRPIVADGLPPEAVLGPLALSAVLGTLGVLAFERRDLRGS